jgi:proteic killer suppression protein
MIQSFADDVTQKVWMRERVSRLGLELQRGAQKKLRLLNATGALGDLRVPPGTRLEKLVGDRKDQYSIRVNSQHRICFRWTDAGPADVGLTDYHD